MNCVGVMKLREEFCVEIKLLGVIKTNLQNPCRVL